MELIGAFDKFPDFAEVYREHEGAKPKIKFVMVRRNSRAFPSDLRMLLELLRDAGFEVVVRVGSAELTLDEFDKGDAYHILSKSGYNQHIAQSTYYNKQSELRRLEKTLEAMPTEAEERYEIGRRVQNLKAMLGVSDSAVVSADALKKSDEALKKLEQMAYNDNSVGYHALSEEELARVPINKITAEMVNNGDKTIVSKWMIARCKERIIQYTAELTLQPDNIDLRSKIIAEEEAIKDYQAKLEQVRSDARTK